MSRICDYLNKECLGEKKNFEIIFCVTLAVYGVFGDIYYDEGNYTIDEITIGEAVEYNKINCKVNDYKNDISIPTTLGENITTNNNFVRVEFIVFNGESV